MTAWTSRCLSDARRSLADTVRRIGALASRTNKTIDIALGDFSKGLALIELIEQREDSRIKSYGSFFGEAVLCFWKVIETLLGMNPDSAGFQKRARQLGLDPLFVDQEVRPLYGMRNDADVAHALRQSKRSVGRAEVYKARETSSKVLDAAIRRQ